MADRPASTHARPERDGLERLLETERRLADRLAAAEAEARGIRRAAERRAAEFAALDGADLEEALAALAGRISASRDAACQTARAEREAARARYTDLTDDRVEAAAEAVLRALLSDAAPAP